MRRGSDWSTLTVSVVAASGLAPFPRFSSGFTVNNKNHMILVRDDEVAMRKNRAQARTRGGFGPPERVDRKSNPLNFKIT